MAGLMIWLGAAGFSKRRAQTVLLFIMTGLGVAVGLTGLAHVLSWDKVNWLGLDSSTSFATFVSRNSAGAFLNVCLAASIGLAARMFSKARQSDQRYAYTQESPALRLLHAFEDILAQLTTFQIASLIATSLILISVICTSSRGAIVSALLGSLVAMLFSFSTKKNKLGLWVFVLFVLGIGVTGVLSFGSMRRSRVVSPNWPLRTACSIRSKSEDSIFGASPGKHSSIMPPLVVDLGPFIMRTCHFKILVVSDGTTTRKASMRKLWSNWLDRLSRNLVDLGLSDLYIVQLAKALSSKPPSSNSRGRSEGQHKDEPEDYARFTSWGWF